MRPFDDIDDSLEDLRLRRESDGTFVQDNRGHDTGCDNVQDRCVDDDEPDSEGVHLPGTVDDLPYSLAEDGSEPTDLLGSAAKHLVEEDEREGIRLEGEDAEDARRVMDALGEDAAEALPHSPNGVSATGDASLEEHGGFPSRK